MRQAGTQLHANSCSPFHRTNSLIITPPASLLQPVRAWPPGAAKNMSEKGYSKNVAVNPWNSWEMQFNLTLDTSVKPGPSSGPVAALPRRRKTDFWCQFMIIKVSPM